MTESAISWPALSCAAAVLSITAYAVLRGARPRWSILALAGAQALLPAWLEFTDTDLPAAAAEGHFQLPSVWHHNTVAMGAVNFLAALALTAHFHRASELPVRLSLVLAVTARRWRGYLLVALRLALRVLAAFAPPVTGPPPARTALPPTCSLTVLLDRVQPCAP
ncbi:hypothetical protein [Streptomyces silvensis]|uniref:hypothetical protein n=1 Tax=Streptomyces silvensis TaxID=1765722 RepID=UPI0012FF30CF|nr:hypothetical protein [Streptomyces silvensis]